MEKIYCLKCKTKKNVNAKKVKVGKNRFAFKGKCPTCGTTCFRFCSKDA